MGPFGASCYMAAKRNQLSAAQSLLQKIRPILHHFGAPLKIQGMVISRAHGIARRACKLQFDVFMPIALFVQDGGRQPAKAEN
jgi:hypothetical protein